MKTFRTLAQAKNDLQEIQEYIQLIENYHPKDLRQYVIYTYARIGNIAKTAEALNNIGYSIDDFSIESEDITRIITSKPPKDDLLHKQIKNLYLKKTRHARRKTKTYY